MIDHGYVNETYVAKSLQNEIYYDKFITYKLPLMKLFKTKYFLVGLYYAQYKHT